MLPINIALMHTGKVLMFAGSGNDPTNVGTTNDAAVWNVSTGHFTKPATPLDANGVPLDLFCAGQTFRSDGTLLVAGGTLQYDPFKGLAIALLFDPATERWVKVPSMNSGRWYPTTLMLSNGRVLAVSGYDTNGRLSNQPERSAVDPRTGGWEIFPSTNWLPTYPNLFQMRDGRVFYSGAAMGDSYGATPRLLTIPSDARQPIIETLVPGLADVDSCNQATSVLLPPAQLQKVMVMGGNSSASPMPVNRVAITSDLTAPNPTYTAAAPLRHARMHLNAVLLPDRTVFVCNGSGMAEDVDAAMLPAEIYDTAKNTWTDVEQQPVPRVYHSAALLLPDGRVLAVGGNPARGLNELRMELYSPSYMSRSRPVIKSAPSSIQRGTTITIHTPQAKTIKWVQLIRPSSNTHSCDTDQRLIDLPITARTANGTLTVTISSNVNLAPPGWYMLFLTDNLGTPSTAAWMHLS